MKFLRIVIIFKLVLRHRVIQIEIQQEPWKMFLRRYKVEKTWLWSADDVLWTECDYAWFFTLTYSNNVQTYFFIYYNSVIIESKRSRWKCSKKKNKQKPLIEKHFTTMLPLWSYALDLIAPLGNTTLCIVCRMNKYYFQNGFNVISAVQYDLHVMSAIRRSNSHIILIVCNL